jgi:hypothetical protein
VYLTDFPKLFVPKIASAILIVRTLVTFFKFIRKPVISVLNVKLLEEDLLFMKKI